MIPINGNIVLAKKHHADAVEEFFNRNRMKPKLTQINRWLVKVFGAGYNLKKVIEADPVEIDRMANLYFANGLKPIGNKHVKYIKAIYTDYFAAKRNTFLIHNSNPYRAYNLVEHLGITVCPYCDRTFIINVPKDGKRTSQLDHFYSKDKYPFLALSFYNLIPSCYACNHVKSNNDKRLLNPYTIGVLPPVTFKIKIVDTSFYNNVNGFKLQWVFKTKYMKNNFHELKLHKIYPTHKDIIIDVIQKKYIYTEAYLQYLLKKIKGEKVDLSGKKDNLINLILGFNVTDNYKGNRPLTKLVKDIWYDLDNHKKYFPKSK